MKKLQASGHVMSKDPPYGWKRDPKDKTKWTKHPAEWEAVLKMRDLKRKGMGDNAIATYLDKEGYQRRGSRWYHTTVSRTLAREGLHTHKKDTNTLCV
jgi:hypothetical protein